jgi:hypothetical protein
VGRRSVQGQTGLGAVVRLSKHAAALSAGIVTREDVATIERAARLRDAVIRVDDFALDFGLSEAAQPVVQRRQPGFHMQDVASLMRAVSDDAGTARDVVGRETAATEPTAGD